MVGLLNIRNTFPAARAVLIAAVSVFFLMPPAFGVPPRMRGSLEQGQDVLSRASRVQIPFVANEGQIAESRVKFYARTFGGTVYVTDDGQIVYSFHQFDFSNTEHRTSIGTCIVREELIGARQSFPRLRGVGQSVTRVNWFKGNDAARWRTNLRSYEWVRFGEVYEGIEFGLRAYGHNVEKIFFVKPGADPGQIRVRLEGVERVEVTPDEELELTTALGKVRFSAPVAYQLEKDRYTVSREALDTSAATTPLLRYSHTPILPVQVAYSVEGNVVSFEIGSYDRDRPLIIDPLVASTFLGGGNADVIRAMALDHSTNIYVAGYTASSDFPMTSVGYHTNYYGGDSDAFISKFDGNLETLLASTFLGGASNDAAYALAINTNDGAVYVAGYTMSTNFPCPESSAYSTNYSGNGDVFISKLDSNLADLAVSTYLGGTNEDVARGVGVDVSNDVFVAGYTASTNFPTNNVYGTTYIDTHQGSNDVFVTRLSSNLFTIKASTYIGGSNDDLAFAMAVDTNSVYVTGYTMSSNFPMTNYFGMINVIETNYHGAKDVFIARFYGDLTNVYGTTYLGGTNDDVAYGIALGYTTKVLVVGYTESSDYPNVPSLNVYAPGYTNQYRGGRDAFITHIDKPVTITYFSSFFGGTNDDVARSVLIDKRPSGSNVYVTGYTTSSNFPVTTNAYDMSANGGRDVFLFLFQGQITNLTASTYLGGSGDDEGYALGFDPEADRVFVAGSSAGNFPVTPSSYQQFQSGGYNGFVSKLVGLLSYGTMKWQFTLSSAGGTPTFGLDGTIYVGDDSGYLYAVDANGQQVWKSTSLGDIINSAPAVGSNGTIYVCSGEGYNKVYGISANGAINMTYTLTNAAIQSPAIGADGTLYASTYFPPYVPYIYAIDPIPPAGELKWRTDLGAASIGSPVVGTNGLIYVTASGDPSFLYTFNTNGTLVRTNLMGLLAWSSPAIGSNGVIYVGSGTNLYAFSSSGETNWISNLDGSGARIESSPVIGTNGTIYVGNSNDSFFALKDNGATVTTNWVRDLGAAVKSSAAIGENGTIYVGSGNKLYALNPNNGTTKWSFNAGSAIGLSSPLLGSDGTVYIVGGTTLFAIWGQEQIASTPWPMFQHDQLRTRNSALGDTAPDPPASISATWDLTDRIRVSWPSASNATMYEVWRALTNTVASAIYIGASSQSPYDDGSITIGYNYWYWVKSKNALKAGALSSSSALGGTPPLPPMNVDATDGMLDGMFLTNYVRVTWNASDGAHGYHVYRSLLNDTNSAVSNMIGQSITTTNYDDYTVIPGLSNYYWIRAYNMTSTGTSSDVDSGGVPPSVPTNFAAVQGTTTNYLEVTWDESAGATLYELFRDTSTSGSSRVWYFAVTNTYYRDVATTPCREYTYWVKATNWYGISAYSTSATGFRALAPPKSVLATDGLFTNKVSVSWEIESTNALSYVIYRSATNDTSTASWRGEVPYTNSASTNYSDLEISRGAAYYYWVKAKNDYGTSAFSQSDEGGTPPSAPGGVSVSDGTYTGKVQVSWEPSSYATGYEIYRHTSAESGSAAMTGTSSETNYDDTAAMPGVRYYYWLKATNIFGRSKFSGFDSGWRDLAPPMEVAATDGISTNHLWVTWSTSVNATAYEVWRSTESDSNTAAALASNVETNSYDDLSSTAGQVYYYWIKAKNATFTGGLSDYDSGYRALGHVDLGVSDLVFLPPVLGPGGRPSAISFHLTNYGDADMESPNYWVTNDFYISANSTFGDSDDIWIGGSSLSADIAVNDSTKHTLSQAERSALMIPSSALGAYYVFVHVQHALPSTWNDPVPGNNYAQRGGGPIQVSATVPVVYGFNDFSGDGKADLAVYHEATGLWYIRAVDGTAIAWGESWGGEGFTPVAGDFDNDGQMDLAVYHDESGQWFIRTLDGSLILWAAAWGSSGFVPVWGDYNADNQVDMTVYHEETGAWYIRSVGGAVIAWAEVWGGSGYTPVCGDYDGDGRTDLAVYHTGDYNWYIRSLSGSILLWAGSWGGDEGFIAVPGDYDGDGVADLAIYHESSGYWFIISMTGTQILWGAYWGGTGYTPVPGDYDGDGKCDLALYYEDAGAWFVLSVAGDVIVWNQSWGGAGFKPVSVRQ